MVPGITGRSAYRVPHPASLSYSKKQKMPPCRKTECQQTEHCPEEGRLVSGNWVL